MFPQPLNAALSSLFLSRCVFREGKGAEKRGEENGSHAGHVFALSGNEGIDLSPVLWTDKQEVIDFDFALFFLLVSSLPNLFRLCCLVVMASCLPCFRDLKWVNREKNLVFNVLSALFLCVMQRMIDYCPIKHF